MPKLFKPGDRVQRKTGGPVMTVQRYSYDHKPWLGWFESDHYVECSYLSGDGYKREIIHQNSLVNATSTNTILRRLSPNKLMEHTRDHIHIDPSA